MPKNRTFPRKPSYEDRMIDAAPVQKVLSQGAQTVLKRPPSAPPPVDPESREGKLAALAERRKAAANASEEDRYSYVEGSWGDVGYALTAADFSDDELVAVANGAFLDAYKDEAMGGDGNKWRQKAAPAVAELGARKVPYAEPGRPTPHDSAMTPISPPNDPSRGR